MISAAIGLSALGYFGTARYLRRERPPYLETSLLAGGSSSSGSILKTKFDSPYLTLMTRRSSSCPKRSPATMLDSGLLWS
jgi:hypothetical protein